MKVKKQDRARRFVLQPPSGDKEYQGDFGDRAEDYPPLSRRLSENIEMISRFFHTDLCQDLIIRRLRAGGVHPMAVVYLEGMSSQPQIADHIIRPLLCERAAKMPSGAIAEQLMNLVEISDLKQVATLQEGVDHLLNGDCLLLCDGEATLFACDVKGFEKRSVEAPRSESAVRGAQEGFNETYRTNLTLLRKQIKSTAFVAERTTVGDVNRSLCAVVYLDGLINPGVVEEIKRRLNGIKSDLVMGSGMLEQFIEDNPFSPFPNVISTERPDRAAQALCEGKAVVIVDGSPFVLIMPVSIGDLLLTPEDSLLRFEYGTLLRVVRLLAFGSSLLLAAIYISMLNFHHEMVPTGLLLSISQSRISVPFSSVVELILMETAYELVREAGVRIPGILGGTVGIAGALILGQAAVEAGLVSSVTLIIVAFAGLGSYAMPDYALTLGARMLRLGAIVAAGCLGIIGVGLFVVFWCGYLCSIYSFGVPMMSFEGGLKNRGNSVIARRPVWKNEHRPGWLRTQHRRSQPPVSRVWTREEEQKDDG